MVMRAQWPALLGDDDLTIAQIVSERPYTRGNTILSQVFVPWCYQFELEVLVSSSYLR